MIAGLLLSFLLLFQVAPVSYPVLLQRGLRALEAGHLEEAEAAFQQARELQPTRAAAYYNLGEVFSRRGQSGEAIANFRKAIQLAPQEPLSYLRLAALEAQLQRFHEAEQTLKRLLELRPGYADAYLLLGHIARERDEHALAEKYLRRYVRLRPRDPKGLGELGSVLLREEKFKEGEALLKRALALDPSLGIAQYNLGLLYNLRGDLQKGRPHLEAAVKLLPANANAQYQLGVMLVRIGELESAEKAFRKALELSPEHLESLYALGTLLGQLGRSEEAAEVLAEHERRNAAALEQRQRDRRVSAYHMDAKRFLEEDRVDSADEKLAEILRLDPKNDLAYYRQSQVLFLRQEYERALEKVKVAIEKKNFEPAYHLLEAMCLERLGHDEKAAQAYERVIQLADYAEAYLALGRIELRQGKRAEAITHLRRAAALEPKDPDVRQALREALGREKNKK